MGIFSFLTKKVGEKTADYWTGYGLKNLEEENFEKAIKAFNEVIKLYQVEGYTNPIWREDLKQYLHNIYIAFLGLSLAHAALNNFIPADDNYRKVKTLIKNYQSPNAKDFLKRMKLDKLIGLVDRIENHKFKSHF